MNNILEEDEHIFISNKNNLFYNLYSYYHLNLKNKNINLINIFNNIYLYKIILIVICTNYLIYSYKTESLLFYSNLINKNNYNFKNINGKIYLNPKITQKFNNFIKVCHNDIKIMLINSNNSELVNNPKITIIIPLYNAEKYIHYSLRSIQNQKMKDIEIILVDDCSSDNTIMKIKKYMNEDQRIKLIKNNKHRKILYSKSIASLNAHGKYIIQLDQDDMFIKDDVFDTLYAEAIKYNLDIIQFRDFIKDNFYFKKRTHINDKKSHYIFPKPTHYKKQPELKQKMFTENNNYLLWGLLISTNLYKKAIYKLWPIIINYKIIYNEDYIITSMIILLAKNYKYLNNFCIIHLIHSNSATLTNWNNNEFYISILFFAQFIYEYYIKYHPKEISLLINYINFYSDYFKTSSKLYPDFFNLIFNYILDNEYLTYNDINNLKIKLSLDSELYEKNNSEYFINSTDILKISKYSNNFLRKKITNSPIFSIIILFNDIKLLEKTIESIYNQHYTNYEIFLINNQNTNLDSFKKYQNFTIIDNKNQKGLLYLYSIGILMSKGNYILTLKSGFILFQNNTLDILSNYITNNYSNTDIFEFNLLINNKEEIYNNSFKIYKCQHFKTKINLTIIKNNENYIEIDQNKEIISNKLIKATLYKNMINKYELYKYKENIYNYFDDILLLILFKNKAIFKPINIFGLIVSNKYLNDIQNNEYNIYDDTIFYINFLFDNSGNTFKDKKEVLNEFFNYLSIIYNKFILSSYKSNILLQKFMNSKYISLEDKKELYFYYNSLIN